jgi:hypothetical protein
MGTKIFRCQILFLILNSLFIAQTCFGQRELCDNFERELNRVYSKIFPFYYDNHDSLDYYSDLFSEKLITYLKNNPSTIECKFQLFLDSIGSIVTTRDGLFRIYSWNTWTGGTMSKYKNLFQFKSNERVYLKELNYGEGDMGTYYSDVYSLKDGTETHILAIAGGSESSKYGYEFLTLCSISDSTIFDNDQIIITPTGLKSSMVIEYEYSKVNDRLPLIRYDPDKETFYIPIFSDDGAITDRSISYKFTDHYFEKINANDK